jgi:hypothetical protein
MSDLHFNLNSNPPSLEGFVDIPLDDDDVTKKSFQRTPSTNSTDSTGSRFEENTTESAVKTSFLPPLSKWGINPFSGLQKKEGSSQISTNIRHVLIDESTPEDHNVRDEEIISAKKSSLKQHIEKLSNLVADGKESFSDDESATSSDSDD